MARQNRNWHVETITGLVRNDQVRIACDCTIGADHDFDPERNDDDA